MLMLFWSAIAASSLGARDIVEIAVAARCGLPGNIGGVIDEREQERAAEPCPEEAVDRPGEPGAAERV
jgi:hypothetical protein